MTSQPTPCLWSALLLASIPFCFSQPPSNAGYVFSGTELPGNPLPVIALGGDGQDCAFQCMADLACVAFNYEPFSCNDKRCPFESGCCWLLSAASSTNMTKTLCSGSMMMRPPLGSVPSPPPLPSPSPSAKNVIYILADDMRPDVRQSVVCIRLVWPCVYILQVIFPPLGRPFR